VTLATALSRLNPEQRLAVEHRGSPLLVLAGAGSGKTRVITVRIAHLVHYGLPAEQVLALTFTNKAAGEMVERVAELCGSAAAERMTLGTFHALGLRILEVEKRHFGHQGALTILDAADQVSTVRQCLKALRIDPHRHDPRTFLTTISNARNAGKGPAELGREPGRELTARVYTAYLEQLHAYRAFDFDDLLLKPVELFERAPEVLAKWRARCSAILIDEYQDTNPIQLRLVRLLGDAHRNLCAVGDDDQSIYGWRGATRQNILEFERHFPDGRVLALTQNYRSTGAILAAANAVIEGSRERRKKQLWTADGPGDPVRVVACKDDRAEAAFVAAEIHRLKAASALAWRDFGVLFRSSAQVEVLGEGLRLAGIPYRVVGASDFYERKEVKDALALCRLLVQPHDQAGLLRVINFPPRGMGPARVEAWLELASRLRIAPFEALARGSESSELPAAQRAALGELHRALAEGHRACEQGGEPTEVFLGLTTALGAREAWLRDNSLEGSPGERWRHIERLLEGMRAFRRRRPGASLAEYLQLVALDGRRQGEESDLDQVALMTLHAAKGLEWPACFVVGCQEGLLPHQRSLDGGGDLDEERRLFYVGLTRARRVAALTWARTRRRYQGLEQARPSRFLADIPAACRADDDRSQGGGSLSAAEVSDRISALKARLSGR
jgi:superfamily I DNA/RNA helicase